MQKMPCASRHAKNGRLAVANARTVMIALDHHPSGRHFLQIPGPSPVPDRILRAMSLPTIDHRGPEFAALGLKVIDGLKQVFRTRHPVAIYPASGTGAWEAALANTMSPGDALLMFETGHFATLWHKMALRLGLQPEFLAVPGTDAITGLPNGWRRGVQADLIEQRLRTDAQRRIRAVCVVHNETSTGVTSDIAAVRRAIDAASHPALLMVDTISGLACADYRHDEWGIDVSISGSQKGLMLPPGISFNALSSKALGWSEGVRDAVRALWLPIQCADANVYSPVLTGVITPAGVDADALRELIH
jgi:alanine-glyoxylate transaminase/serine-glyoxylate transaminase/serine-pyruvate transaminase